MAFASSITKQTVEGDGKINYGTFTQASGDTGGAITTGFTTIEYFDANYSTDNSDSSGTVTITTADPGGAQTGYWTARGR